MNPFESAVPYFESARDELRVKVANQSGGRNVRQAFLRDGG